MESNAVFVGNAGSLLNMKQGDFIDSHEHVYRFNNFRIMPEHTGIKTDTWITSYYKDIVAPDPMPRAVMCPFPLSCGVHWKNIENIKIPLNQVQFIPLGIYRDLIRMVPNPSTGIAAIYWYWRTFDILPHLCGFSFFTEGKHHYMDDQTACKHDGKAEKKLLECMEWDIQEQNKDKKLWTVT